MSICLSSLAKEAFLPIGCPESGQTIFRAAQPLPLLRGTPINVGGRL